MTSPILLVEIVPIEKWGATAKNIFGKKDQEIITKYTVEILAQNTSGNTPPEHTIFKTEDDLKEYIKDKNIYLINKDGTTKVINDDVKKILVDPNLPAGVRETIKNASSNIGKEIEKQSGNITDWVRSVGEKIVEANPAPQPIDTKGGERKTKRKQFAHKKSSRRKR
jgi:hypothetical protein